jgi:hypothetical protein
MGIFSRWALTIPDATGQLDEVDRGHQEKAQREVKDQSQSLAEFLKQRQLIPADDVCAVERGRQRVERSGLLTVMLEMCAEINTLVGRTIVDVHTFLPPDPILCCFIFVEDGTEYLIRLELQGETLALIFAERRWRDTVTNDFVRWAHRLAEIEPVTINIKLVHEFDDIRVSTEQVRNWFMYLVSGMDRSHTPSF